MFLHLGMDKVITFDEIIGIFDLDTTTVSKTTRNYLSKAEKEGRVESVSLYDLPKSFVVCKKDGETKVYLSPISSTTLFKRTGFVDSLKNSL